MAYTFLSWLRSGLAAAIEDLPQSVGAGRRTKLQVGVNVAGTGLPAQTGTIDLDVLGPGDVTGIDTRQVIRTFPVPGTLDFTATYHAHAEFDRPDLPWMFTPFGPTAAGALRPWICLVVLEDGADAVITPGLPLPLLTVTGTEIAALPALSDAHRWAHVQITGSTAAGVKAINDNEPERILSRLICPRDLRPGTDYLACIVPTFEIGALAGLGRPVPDAVRLDAWSTADARVELPVYHSWQFTTGRGGDFRSLVLRLSPRPVPSTVGTRGLDVTKPGFGLADRAAPAVVPLGGALRVTPAAAAPVDATLAAELQDVVNVDRAVAPPIYGRWHAAVAAVRTTAPLNWVAELNLDPRHRVAAGLGTRVVQERQEDLMAAVWEQLGEILRANTLLRQGQLAVAVAERVVARHLAPLPDAALLLVAGPAAARIRTAANLTVRGEAAASCLPVLALSGAFRRIARPRGPLDRRFGRSDHATFPDVLPAPALDSRSLLERLASGSLAAPDPRLPSGAVAVPIRRRRPAPDDPLAELTGTFALLRRRAAAHACTSMDVAGAAGAVRAAIVPDVSVADRVRAQITIPAGGRVKLSARLDPVMAAPEIPTPMIGSLQELGQDWLLPGIGDLPPNTVSLVEPDTAFIESYMVGLNHEMARELLWRGFPTDQRGTVFSRFWDRRAAVSTRAAPAPARDLPDIHTWAAMGAALGGHLDSGGGTGLVILLVRGDLLQRYPRATIYLQRGRWLRDQRGDIVFDGELARREPVPVTRAAGWTADVRFPQFGGPAGADVLFLGFPLATQDVRGVDGFGAPPTATDDQAGWYVVFEEQPTEPRFGAPPPPPAPQPPAATAADQLAAQRLRPAFRLSVHASDLIGS
jgi:hypothetical protein